MRVIKLAILSFISLFLLVTIISLFIPGNIRISKAINFATDDTSYFNNIFNLATWRKWHPALKDIPETEFKMLSHNMVIVYGTKITLEDRTDDEVFVNVTNDKKKSVWNGFKFIKHIQGDSSTLQWYTDFKLPWYPWEKFKSLFFENIYGVQMEQGLANLKELSEGRRSSIN